jgi:hypothetical protein
VSAPNANDFYALAVLACSVICFNTLKEPSW